MRFSNIKKKTSSKTFYCMQLRVNQLNLFEKNVQKCSVMDKIVDHKTVKNTGTTLKQRDFTLRNIGRWADGNFDIPQRLSVRWKMWIETMALLDDIPLVTSILTRLESIEIPDSSTITTKVMSLCIVISVGLVLWNLTLWLAVVQLHRKWQK